MGSDVREKSSSEGATGRRVLWWAIGGGAAAVAVAVAGVTLSSGLHPTTGRGEPLQALPTGTPRPVPTDASLIDDSSKATSVDGVWSDARSGVEAKALTRSDCLDDAARTYAEAAVKAGGTGESPAVPKSDCGGDTTFGYVLGFDESGLSQATAALTATKGKVSPLVAEGEREVGWSLVPSKGDTGHVNGYVLGWAVSK
ncbi:hypothetical protein [Microbacterium sp. 13-71-7]|uniref:hypothetical protein n=1 Tax=Microbacterium sp. 13-71-7 TaxID=1970399 RepID=UPI0025F74977|nr:hypothetical protein [Microbacterium sp. 13-71-7]